MKGIELGLQFLLILALFLFVGYWIDQQLKWGFPVFLLVFLFLGFGAALYILIRSVNSMYEKKNPKNNEKK